jgi:hypothetical protein
VFINTIFRGSNPTTVPFKHTIYIYIYIPITIEVLDIVYRMNLASSKAQNTSAKLLLRLSKPMVIAKIVRPNVVLLANPETGVNIGRSHVNQPKELVG